MSKHKWPGRLTRLDYQITNGELTEVALAFRPPQPWRSSPFTRKRRWADAARNHLLRVNPLFNSLPAQAVRRRVQSSQYATGRTRHASLRSSPYVAHSDTEWASRALATANELLRCFSLTALTQDSVCATSALHLPGRNVSAIASHPQLPDWRFTVSMSAHTDHITVRFDLGNDLTMALLRGYLSESSATRRVRRAASRLHSDMQEGHARTVLHQRVVAPGAHQTSGADSSPGAA